MLSSIWIFISALMMISIQAKPVTVGLTRSATPKISEWLANRAARITQQEEAYLDKLGLTKASDGKTTHVKTSNDGADVNEASVDSKKPFMHSSSDTVGVSNYLWSYLITVGIGHPKKEFNLILDTGSSVLWVPTSKCNEQKCPGSSTLELYDTDASNTFVEEKNNSLLLRYGMGECHGRAGEDSIFIGDREIEHQMIGAADDISEGLLTNSVNGILGFGPAITSRTFNTNKEIWKTPLDHLLEKGEIEHNMFSVYFDNVDNDDEFGNANGQLTLGGLPARETYEGEIQWAPRYEESLYKYYWSVKSEGIKVNDRRIAGDLRGIVDTGTTMTFLTPEFGKRVIAAMKIVKFDEENRLYYVECAKTSSLPTLTFILDGGIELSLKPEQYVIPSWQTSYWRVKDTQCPLYISTDAVDDFDFVLGQKFLEYHVAAHDADNKRIGFAPSVHKAK